MKKLASLRAHILSIPSEVKIDPDNLTTIGTEGAVLSHSEGTNQHFEYQYNAEIMILNYTGDFLRLTYWVLQWMRQYQPNHEPDALKFQSEIINDNAVDLSFTIPLTETIKAAKTATGIALHSVDDPRLQVVHLPAAQWTMFDGSGTEIEQWLQDG